MQRKLKLNLEQLSVDTFHTSSARAEKGTVFGEQCTCYTNCTCPGCPTCYATCAGNTCAGTCGPNTCAASCNGTCGDSCDCGFETCLNTACGPSPCCI